MLLKPVGGLAAAAMVAYIGYQGSEVLQHRQETTAKAQLYAEIMSGREEAETGLRREMFNSIIQTFLRSGSGGSALTQPRELEQRMLAVELLTYNFHDALDLGALFKYLERDTHKIFSADAQNRNKMVGRLKRTARDVVAKQVALLEVDGWKKSKLFELKSASRGLPGIQEILPAAQGAESSGTEAKPETRSADTSVGRNELPPKKFRLEVIDWNLDDEEVKVRLTVNDPKTKDVEFDEVFWVGSFDFPLIDNAHIAGGGRCAVILEKFVKVHDTEQDLGNRLYGNADLTLLYFHGSRASLRSKRFYEDMIEEAIGL